MFANKQYIDHITHSVMNVYKKVNPSFVENIATEKARKEYFLKWSNLIVKKLKIPPLCFCNSTLLDVGCGSGEKSLVYASLGARVLGLDINEKAIEMAKTAAMDWGENIKERVEFRVCSVFKIDIDQSFDIIVSDGVIHHTAYPKKAFNNFVRLLRPGGVLLLGLAEPCGFFQRQLQRYFVNKIAESYKEETKLKIAIILFEEKLKRASKVSGRSVISTAYDSFINPQIVPIAFHEVKNWMDEYDVHLDCTWPPSDIPLQTDSQYHELLESSNQSVLGWETLSRVFWMLNNKHDKDLFNSYKNYDSNLFDFLKQIPSICSDNSLKTHALSKTLKQINEIETTPLPGLSVEKDLSVFIREILHANKEIDIMKSQGLKPEEIAKKLNFRRLFAGFSGVGMVYYRGTKNLNKMDRPKC
jgi:2-polyprenyl-3-methyl-5-hydroxy-6-metoxy-1,4-benzoquinol methylase